MAAEGLCAYARVRRASGSPCTGVFTQLAPAAPGPGATPRARLTLASVEGVRLKDGTYRVVFERVGD